MAECLTVFFSVRSTNVYEEQSLGVFDPQEHDDDDAESNVFDPQRTTTWSRYLAMHARQQLAFGKSFTVCNVQCLKPWQICGGWRYLCL